MPSPASRRTRRSSRRRSPRATRTTSDLKQLLVETDDPTEIFFSLALARHSRRVRRAQAGVRRDRTASTATSRWRSSRHRLRHREDVRAGAVDRHRGRPAEPLRQDPGDRARAAGDRGLHRARHLDQHHADLLARPLQGGRRGIHARARAARRRRRRSVEGRVGRVVLRLARRHRGRQAPRGGRPPRAEGQARHRQREARLPALSRGVLRAALGVPRRQGRATSSAVSGRRRRRRTPTTAT